ncbi:MAG TPA: glycosyltransferase [Patescibacteria group bacterium]|jgi:glycosyltransferase involved in cell wall biosynthesis|nr:glycosyltransferase [Patescibacteria group bacterium]
MLLKNKKSAKVENLVSVIIPTKNSEKVLSRCLQSIKNQSYKNIEIIIIDNNSIDKTKLIASKFTTQVFNKGPERSAQRNFGVSKAKGEYLLFIDSDMVLSRNVVGDCVLLSQKSEVRSRKPGGIVIPEESFGEGFWASCKALERSFYLKVKWIEAPRFFSKSVFMELKGFDEKLISGEDWDLGQKAKAKYKVLRISSFIKHDEGNLSLVQLLKKKMYYGKQITNYSSKEENNKDWKRQSSIAKRYELFFSNPQKLFSNPMIGIGMLFMKTCEFAVVGLGYLLKE